MILILTDITEFTIHARYVSGLLVLIENIPLYPNPIILAGLTKLTIIKSTGFFSLKKKKNLFTNIVLLCKTIFEVIRTFEIDSNIRALNCCTP